MKQDVETVSRLGNFSVPKNFTPELIVDLGIRTIYSTKEYMTQFPKAKILSFSSYNSNFLVDQNELDYHDNITFKSFSLNYIGDDYDIDLDRLIYMEIPFDKIIDFIKLDLKGKEKNILKSGGRWANNTRYIKARLADYDYKEAKSDLYDLGFYSAAMHDGHSYYVIGERID